jgi:hypothetical protein
MKRIAAILLMFAAAAVQAQPDDIAVTRFDDASVIALSSQLTPLGGYYWYHVDDASGRTYKTGYWTVATHSRVALMDGKGGVVYIPISRFQGNPNFDK